MAIKDDLNKWQLFGLQDKKELAHVSIERILVIKGDKKWGIRAAIKNVFEGRRSKSGDEPIQVTWIITENKFLITDGYHRLVEQIIRRKKEFLCEIDWSGYSLDWKVPEVNNRFVMENRKMKITKSQLKKIVKEELKSIFEYSEKHVARLKKKFPNYSEQELRAMAQAVEELPRGSKDPQHSQGIPRVEKKPELRRLGIDERELREIEGLDQYEAGEYEMLAAKWNNPGDPKYNMSADDIENLERLQSKIWQARIGPRGMSSMNDEDAHYFNTLVQRREEEWTDEEKQKMSHLRAKYRMDVDPGFSGKPSVDVKPVEPVDPYAPTEEIPDDAPTVRTPRLARESKKISKSKLRQVVAQELKAVLKEN